MNKKQERAFNTIRQMSDKEKDDVCRDQSTHGPVEGCSIAGMSCSDCLKCPISTIDTSHLLYSIWHDNMVEIGYLKT